MATARRTALRNLGERALLAALVLTLATAGCGLAQTCAGMMAGDCCCAGMASMAAASMEDRADMPCREMSGEAQDNEKPRGDATLQAPTHESPAVLPETSLTAAASTVLVDVQRPSTDFVDRPPDLYLRNCSFLC